MPGYVALASIPGSRGAAPQSVAAHRRQNGVDLAYIDGDHEKVATIRYFERIKPHLNPDAVVIFGDISWVARRA